MVSFHGLRNIYADLMMNSSESLTHVFAIKFAEEDRFGGTQAFANALDQRLSLLSSSPTNQKDTGSSPYVPTTTFGGGDISESIWNFNGISSPIPQLENASWGVGVTVATPSVEGTPNFDNTIRSAPLIVSANDVIYPSLALETLRVLFNQDSYQTKVTEEVGIEWIRMGKQPPIETTTSDIMISYWNSFDRISASDLPQSDLTNKVVIWGLTAEGLNNPISTPVGVLYPHEVQANQIQTVLQEVRIQQSYYLEFVETFLLLISLLGILVVVYTFPTVLSGIASLGIVGFQVGLGYYLWIYLSF